MSDFQVIAVTSGKGGVGKTTVCGNLAVAFAQAGQRVLAIDADLGLADLNYIFGVRPTGTIKEVLDGTKDARDIIVKTPSGVDLMPASAASFELANLSDAERASLFAAIDAVDSDYNVVLVDTGAGLNANAMGFAAAASRVLVVVTPDPTSIADAYAVIKVLSQRYGVREFNILTNQVASSTEADRIYEALLRLTQRFLTVRLHTPGYICRDSTVERALRSGEPFVSQSPKGVATQGMRALASSLLKEVPGSVKSGLSGGLQLFWQRLSGNDQFQGERAQ